MDDSNHSWNDKRKAVIEIKRIVNKVDPENAQIKFNGLILGSIKKHCPYTKKRLSLKKEVVKY